MLYFESFAFEGSGEVVERSCLSSLFRPMGLGVAHVTTKVCLLDWRGRRPMSGEFRRSIQPRSRLAFLLHRDHKRSFTHAQTRTPTPPSLKSQNTHDSEIHLSETHTRPLNLNKNLTAWDAKEPKTSDFPVLWKRIGYISRVRIRLHHSGRHRTPSVMFYAQKPSGSAMSTLFSRV